MKTLSVLLFALALTGCTFIKPPAKPMGDYAPSDRPIVFTYVWDV